MSKPKSDIERSYELGRMAGVFRGLLIAAQIAELHANGRDASIAILARVRTLKPEELEEQEA